MTTLWQACNARRQRVRGQDRRGQIPNMTPITERPTDVATQTIPGYWEGDVLKGARNGSAVSTQVERTTRLVLLVHMDSTVAASAYRGFTKELWHVPSPPRKTLTYDRGKEIANHEQSAHRLAIQVFFADLHGPWQRGINKNTSGQPCRQLPKNTDLSGDTQRQLNAIAHRLNTRPRKCLVFATPLEVHAQLRSHSTVAVGT